MRWILTKTFTMKRKVESSNHTLKAIFDHLPDAVILQKDSTDKTGRIQTQFDHKKILGKESGISMLEVEENRKLFDIQYCNNKVDELFGTNLCSLNASATTVYDEANATKL